MKKTLLSIIAVCILTFITVACDSTYYGAFSTKAVSDVEQLSLSKYGNDITLKEATDVFFLNYDFNNADVIDNDGLYVVTLIGKDVNDYDWTIKIHYDREDLSNWYGVVDVFSNIPDFFYSNMSLDASDTLMTYFATDNTIYLDTFFKFYCIGDNTNKSYDIVDDFLDYYDIIYTENSVAFIKRYDELFPCENGFIPFEVVISDMKKKEITKSMDRYSDKLVFLNGLTIQNVSETKITDTEYITTFTSFDDDFNFYQFFYCGELPNVYDENTISALVLPIGTGSAKNSFGGETFYNCFLISSLVNGTDVTSITDRILSETERSALANEYLMESAYDNAIEEQDANLGLQTAWTLFDELGIDFDSIYAMNYDYEYNCGDLYYTFYGNNITYIVYPYLGDISAIMYSDDPAHPDVYMLMSNYVVLKDAISLIEPENSINTVELDEYGYPIKYSEQREKFFYLIQNLGKAMPITTSNGRIVLDLNEEYKYAYYGEMKDSMPDGFGLICSGYDYYYDHLYYPTSFVFFGEFKEGKPCGYGMLLFSGGYFSLESDNFIFTDDYGRMEFNANGTGFEIERLFEWEYGDSYYDEETDSYDVKYNYYFGNAKIYYAGDFKNGVRDGYGLDIMYLDEVPIIVYQGDFENGNYSGKGILYYENGQIKYSGEFKNGQFNGNGVLYDEDGFEKYIGEFLNGQIK